MKMRRSTPEVKERDAKERVMNERKCLGIGVSLMLVVGKCLALEGWYEKVRLKGKEGKVRGRSIRCPFQDAFGVNKTQTFAAQMSLGIPFIPLIYPPNPAPYSSFTSFPAHSLATSNPPASVAEVYYHCRSPQQVAACLWGAVLRCVVVSREDSHSHQSCQILIFQFIVLLWYLAVAVAVAVAGSLTVRLNPNQSSAHCAFTAKDRLAEAEGVLVSPCTVIVEDTVSLVSTHTHTPSLPALFSSTPSRPSIPHCSMQ